MSLSPIWRVDFNSLKNDIIVLEVTTIHGCVATSRINVIVENELNFFIPNIFSPNNDGNIFRKNELY